MLPVAQIKCRAAGGEEDDLALTSSRGGRQAPSTTVIVAVSGNPRMTKLIGQRLCAVFLSPREARSRTTKVLLQDKDRAPFVLRNFN